MRIRPSSRRRPPAFVGVHQALLKFCCSFGESVNMAAAPRYLELHTIHEPALVGGVGFVLYRCIPCFFHFGT